MKVAVMQPYFFPYIGYWRLLAKCDVFVIFDDVNYINKGFIDRNTIVVNGSPQYIKLKVAARSQNKLICELQIHEQPTAVASLVKSAYVNAPHFHEFFPIVDEICNNEEPSLTHFLQHSIQSIAQFLGIEREILLSSSILSDEMGREKIIPIVKHLGGTAYLNMEGGASLYDPDDFEKEGLAISLVSPGATGVPGDRSEHYGPLSIIDTLMHADASAIREAIS